MKKNILAIDDSALMRRVLSDIINSDERFHVEAVASNGLEGLEILSQNKSIDLIMLDINMPIMDGIEFLQKMKERGFKNKVLVVSMLTKNGAAVTIKCLEYGAFDFVRKPSSYAEARDKAFRDVILERMEEALFEGKPDAKGISAERRISSISQGVPEAKKADREEAERETARRAYVRQSPIKTEPMGQYGLVLGKKPGINCRNKLVAMACSTGGPKSLQSVIPQLPGNLNAPVILVQHMPEGFTFSLAERLNELSHLRVKEVDNGEVLEKGTVYIAKGGFHVRVNKGTDGKYHLAVTDEAARGGLKPCADIMYESIAQLDFDEVTCVVLTGMGGDGSKGIQKLIQENKKIYVIAQDEETSIVYGMPKMIYQTGLVNEVLPLKNIADAITEHVGVR